MSSPNSRGNDPDNSGARGRGRGVRRGPRRRGSQASSQQQGAVSRLSDSEGRNSPPRGSREPSPSPGAINRLSNAGSRDSPPRGPQGTWQQPGALIGLINSERQDSEPRGSEGPLQQQAIFSRLIDDERRNSPSRGSHEASTLVGAERQGSPSEVAEGSSMQRLGPPGRLGGRAASRGNVPATSQDLSPSTASPAASSGGPYGIIPLEYPWAAVLLAVEERVDNKSRQLLDEYRAAEEVLGDLGILVQTERDIFNSRMRELERWHKEDKERLYNVRQHDIKQIMKRRSELERYLVQGGSPRTDGEKTKAQEVNKEIQLLQKEHKRLETSPHGHQDLLYLLRRFRNYDKGPS